MATPYLDLARSSAPLLAWQAAPCRHLRGWVLVRSCEQSRRRRPGPSRRLAVGDWGSWHRRDDRSDRRPQGTSAREAHFSNAEVPLIVILRANPRLAVARRAGGPITHQSHAASASMVFAIGSRAAMDSLSQRRALSRQRWTFSKLAASVHVQDIREPSPRLKERTGCATCPKRTSSETVFEPDPFDCSLPTSDRRPTRFYSRNY